MKKIQQGRRPEFDIPFDKWWKHHLIFDYRQYSDTIAQHFSENFYTWWNSEYFNYNTGGINLIAHCGDYFETWWNPDKIEIKNELGVVIIGCTCGKFIDKWFPYYYKIINPHHISQENRSWIIEWISNNAEDEEKLYLLQKFGIIDYQLKENNYDCI